MKLLHWMKSEKSGLAHTTLEIVKYEERQGHQVKIVQPGDGVVLYSSVEGSFTPDVHCIHSQISHTVYHDGIPKFMWMHGEPLSSVANGVSMKAITDLASRCDAFICMRKEEQVIWNSIRRTHYVPKGIDLEVFYPLDNPPAKLEGEPAILYVENWRQQRNPLYVCVAMQEVIKKLPKAKLHLYNCNDKKMHDTFDTLIKYNKWWAFIRTLSGAVPDTNLLYNRADMVVSGLFPLYARGIESFGAGKGFIGAGYKEPGYPYQCDLDPYSMADAIVKCWNEYGKLDFRQWATDHHDVAETARKSIEIYQRYL